MIQFAPSQCRAPFMLILFDERGRVWVDVDGQWEIQPPGTVVTWRRHPLEAGQYDA